MGKVTIIIESDNVSTRILEDAINAVLPSEGTLVNALRTMQEIYQPDVRIYIVPADE